MRVSRRPDPENHFKLITVEGMYQVPSSPAIQTSSIGRRPPPGLVQGCKSIYVPYDLSSNYCLAFLKLRGGKAL